MVGIFGVSLGIQNVEAQNFADYKPESKQVKAVDQTKATDVKKDNPKDPLTDDVVKQILINEGVPLDYNPTTTESTSKYTLGINDIIEVMVSRHPEVSGPYAINSEGKIQYEFVGDVQLAGKTKAEATDILKEVLSKYIINPEINVKITGYNSKVVYVIGEVNGPGKIYMRGDTISVREALVQAGLPMLSAKSGDGRLVTPSASGKIIQKKVNVYKLLYEGDLRENLVMKPGDTLYLPPTFLAKVMRVISPVVAPITATGGAAGAGRAFVP